MAKRKQIADKSSASTSPSQKNYRVGLDGKTANQRLREEIGTDHGRFARLARLCNNEVPAGDDGKPYIDQRNIQRFCNDDDDLGNSAFVTAIANGLGVRAMWLQHGQLPKKDEAEQVLRELSQRFASRPAPTEPSKQ